MIKGKTTIHSPIGIHARPAALIASCVRNCSSDVVFLYNDVKVDPGNYIKLMSLGIQCGDEIELTVEGSDEQEVFTKLIDILSAM